MKDDPGIPHGQATDHHKQLVEQVRSGLRLSGDPLDSQKARAQLHSHGIGGAVYAEQLISNDQQLVGRTASTFLIATAMDHAKEIVERMNCRDPLEEMLVLQALWTHARLTYLTRLSQQQKCLESLKVVNDACDRATNTYRRLTLAFAEYRKSKKHDSSTGTEPLADLVKHEQGTDEPKDEAAVSTFPYGIGAVERVGGEDEAVASKHWTSNGRRQSPIPPERLEARRTKRRTDRSTWVDHNTSPNGTATSHGPDAR